MESLHGRFKVNADVPGGDINITFIVFYLHGMLYLKCLILWAIFGYNLSTLHYDRIVTCPGPYDNWPEAYD